MPNIATAAPRAPAGIWNASPPRRSLPSYANGVNGSPIAIATVTIENTTTRKNAPRSIIL